MQKQNKLYYQIKIGLILLISSVLSYVVYKNKNKIIGETKNDKTEKAEAVLNTVGVPLVRRQVLRQTAEEVAHHLGTAYSVFSFHNWSENDKEAFDLLVVLSPAEFKIVANLYFEVYAKGRNLNSDLVKFLDKKYYNQLKF